MLFFSDLCQTTRLKLDAIYARSVSPAGFTLIEVLIAVVVLGVALVSILMLQNRSLQLAIDAQHEYEAQMLASNLMEKLILENKERTYSRTGQFEPPWELYRWEIRVSRAPMGSFSVLTVRVLWKEGEYERKYEIEGVITH